MNKKYITAGVYALFFALFFCFFLWPMRAVLSGWEAHNLLFRYSSDFLHLFYRGKPHAFLLLGNCFLGQFYYYPWLGSLIYAAFFTLLSFCINYLARPSKHIGFFITPLLLSVFPYTLMIMPLIVLFIVAGGILWRATPTPKLWAILLRVSVLGVLTFALREFALLAWLLYALIDIIFNKKIYAVLYGGATILWGIVASLIWQPYSFYYIPKLFVFLTLYSQRFFGFPIQYFGPNLSAQIILLIAMLLVCLLPLLSLGLQKIHAKHNLRYVANTLCFLTICASMGLCYGESRDLSTFYKVDHLCRQQNWNEAFQILEKDYPKHTNAKTLTYSNLFYDIQLKTCLLATRKASQQILTYSLLSFPLLFPQNTLNSLDSYILPIYYSFAGQYAASLHTNYDLVTGQSINASVLQSLIETSLIVDDTLPASKFVYMLNQSLFRGKDARQLFARQTPEIQKRIKRGKTLLPVTNFAINTYLPDRNEITEYIFQPQNPYVYEYFLTTCLLFKRAEVIASEFETIKKFYPKGIPRHIQEALLSIFRYEPTRYLYPTRMEGISNEVLNDYWAFVVDDQAYQKQAIEFSELYRRWRHTYWFYDLYTTFKNDN